MSAHEVRVGLLGAGYIADWHCQALRTVPGARVVNICDQNQSRASQLASRHGAETTSTSLDEMLATGGVDAVHVLLPPQTHAAAARTLIDAGVPTYLEKPMCVTAVEASDLEARANPKLAVGHNFLFTPQYERLKSDLTQGRLGRLTHLSIVWVKEFGPLRGGPFGSWVFRDPANILLEVGPHLAAYVHDLVGVPDRVQAEALDPVVLPGGGTFFRRWFVRTYHGNISVDLRMSFGDGVTEHHLHAVGSAGIARLDVEAGTYVLDRPTHLPLDFDRYRRTTQSARNAARQARNGLARYILSKTGLVRDGNAFGGSIARAIRCFHANRNHITDTRLTVKFGAAVVRTCLEIANAAGVVAKPPTVPVSVAAVPVRQQALSPDVLVLGGTGFIGRTLVRKLAASGQRVRVLVRDPASLPADIQGLVDVCHGDLTRHDDVTRAIAGIPAVIHLARSHSRTWDEFLHQDVAVTRSVAEVCLTAGVKRFIYTGTTDSYYSGRDEIITESTPLDPRIHRRNLYARAKALAEYELLRLRREQQLPLVIVRPAVVIGPGSDPCHWGVGFWASSHACRLWGDGTNTLPLVLAEDVADALARCLVADDIDGEIFNLAAEPTVTARDYLATLSAALQTWIDARPTPPWRFFASDVAKWMAKCVIRHPGRQLPSYRDWKSRTYRARYDCSKARNILGWQPISDRDAILEEGVRRSALEWTA